MVSMNRNHLLHVLLLALVTMLAWRVSGYDSKLTGVHRGKDWFRRAVRCALTLPLFEMAFEGVTGQLEFSAGMGIIQATLLLAVLWFGPISSIFAEWFQHLVDPQDTREADLGKTDRDLDQLAQLVQAGKTEEARQLCQELKASGDVSVLAMEALLHHLTNPAKGNALSEAERLRSVGDYTRAEAMLTALLANEPANATAGLMLLRLYCQELERPEKAAEMLQHLREQPEISAGFIEYARRSIDKWSRPGSARRETAFGIESLTHRRQKTEVVGK
jgi:hypothetical protein